MADSQPHPEAGPPERSVSILSFPYSRRLFAILVVGLAIGATVRAAAKPEGFGVRGHWRDAAPAEEAVRVPLLQGKQACKDCHKEELARHDKDVHRSIQCEVCHGPGREHCKARTADAPVDQQRMFRELEPSNCLTCHSRLAARPASHPTIDPVAHYAFRGVTDPKTPCQSCHSPHEPLYLDADVAQARKHPLVTQCKDCHRDPQTASKPLPEGHVAIFDCKDCHEDIAASFASKSHAKDVQCRTCHKLHKETEFSARMFKNGNPQFCLMCHENKPFKGKGKMPLLKSFAAHLDEVASDDEDRQKRCVDCHLTENIHIKMTKKPPLLPPGAATPTGAEAPAAASGTGQADSAPGPTDSEEE